MKTVIEAYDARAAIEKFQAFLGANPVKTPRGFSVKKLIELLPRRLLGRA